MKVEIPHVACGSVCPGLSLLLSSTCAERPSQSLSGNFSLSSQPTWPSFFERPVVTFGTIQRHCIRPAAQWLEGHLPPLGSPTLQRRKMGSAGLRNRWSRELKWHVHNKYLVCSKSEGIAYGRWVASTPLSSRCAMGEPDFSS